MELRYIINNKGVTKAVVIGINEWNKIELSLKKLEQLEQVKKSLKKPGKPKKDKK